MKARAGIAKHRFGPKGRLRVPAAALAIAVLVATVAMPVVASAKFLGEADWQGGKRTLKVRNVANDPWKTWMKEAIANWNSKSAETGWTLQEVGPSEAADVGFVVDSPHSTKGGRPYQCGGAYIRGFGKSPITGLTIHVDEDCTDQEFRAPGGHTHPSGGEGGKGWGKSGATTLDPVLVLKHELSHALRLDHDPAGGVSTGNLEDPIGLGYHGRTTGSVEASRTPSADDVAEAKEASSGVVLHRHEIVGELGAIVDFDGAVVMIPPGALTEPTDVSVRVLPGSGIPYAACVTSARQVPGSGIFQAYQLGPDELTFDVPVQVTMHWSDSALGGGYFLGDTHGMQWEGGPESRLGVFLYDPVGEYWRRVEDAVVNTDVNTATFTTSHFSLYALGLSPPESVEEPTVVAASSAATLAVLGVGGLLGIAIAVRRRRTGA